MTICAQTSVPIPGCDGLPLPVPPISAERALRVARGEQGGEHDVRDDGDIASESSSFNDGDSAINDGAAACVPGIIVPSHEGHYSNPEHLRILEEGGCLFTFECCHELNHYEADMVNSVANLTGFEDETRDNFVPSFDVGDSYTFLLARCAYLLPGVELDSLNDPALLSSPDYQRACQPIGTKVWTDYDKMDRDNFRITKPIIPYLYNFTIQFRASALNRKDLCNLGRHVGVRVDGGLLLERTKRSVPPKEDGTKKAKSVLLYTDLGKGVVLVTHLTVVLQQGLPNVVERFIDKFGSWGLGETCETARKTRTYLQRVIPAKDLEEESSDDEFVDARSTFGVSFAVPPIVSVEADTLDGFAECNETEGSPRSAAIPSDFDFDCNSVYSSSTVYFDSLENEDQWRGCFECCSGRHAKQMPLSWWKPPLIVEDFTKLAGVV